MQVSTIGVRAGERDGVFAALARFPEFRRFWLSAVAGASGQWMQTVALGWIALQVTDSTAFVGSVALMAGLPFFIVSIPGGALIDRFDRRRVLMTCQALAAILAALVAADVLSGRVEPWHLLVAAFLNGSIQAVLAPAQQAIVPRLTPREGLTNAIGLMSAGQNMTRVVGPTLAGAVIGLVGAGEAFLLQLLAILIALALLRRVEIPATTVTPAANRSAALLGGLRIVASRADVRRLFLLASVPMLFVFPYISFLSVFARDELRIGAGGLGLLMAASGTGAVMGSLMVASGRWQAVDERSLSTRIVIYGAMIVGVCLSRSVWLTVPLLVAGGLLGANTMSANNALLQHRISDEIRGRVLGAYMLTWGLMPFGAMPMGLLADRIGIRLAVGVGAVLSSALTAALGYSAATSAASSSSPDIAR